MAASHSTLYWEHTWQQTRVKHSSFKGDEEKKCIQDVNPANFIIVNSGYAEMGLGELFGGRIAETALLLTVALMEQNTEKRIFVSHL